MQVRGTGPGTAAAALLAQLLLLAAHAPAAGAGERESRPWAFEPPRRVPPPDVRGCDWPRGPVDRFILAALEAEGLEPAPPAERALLLRRVTFDLLGLPPEPEEVDAFLEDPSPDAYERAVDRLLASPRHGERWARHWLDIVRFAESHGFEFDRLRESAWRYRDYVIDSLNRDVPYDRFVREQLAGDAIPSAGKEGIVATGFLVAGPWDEAGYTSASVLLKERIREEELEDMIGAVGQTFLGVSIQCARCHDHKFDPVPQRDYYRFKAVFQGVRHGERLVLTAEELEARERIVAATVRRIRELELSLEEIERPARAAAARRACEAPAADAPAGDGPAAEVRATGARAAGPPAAGAPRPAARWTFEAGPADDLGALGGILEGGAAVAGGRLRLDGRGAFARSDPLPRDLREKTLEAWVSLASLDQRGGGVISVESRDGRRFDAIAFAERQARRWMAGSDLFRRTKDLEAPAETAAATELVHVAVVYGSDDRIAFYRNGVPHGKPYVPQAEESSLQTYRRGEAQVLFGLRHTGSTNGLLAGEIEEARVYDRALSNDEVAASFRAGPLLVGDREIDEALGAAERERRAALIGEIRAEREKLRALPPVPRAYAASPAEPGPTFVLARGDVEKKGEPVAAGVLSAVAGPPADFGLPDGAPEGQRRLAFAEWVAHPENPLTARVLANRLWQHHFGRGLVGTPSDFGSNGERPSHPDLLDWLATELVARGWSVKAIHRAIVLSSTYRQGSAHGGAARALAADAEDRLLWRFPLRRLEAEAVRDAMLRLSGQLDLRMGGPSFRPFTVTVSGSNFYHLLDDPAGPELDRRTVYRMGVHSGKDPLLDSLDCPDPSTRTPVRSVTTTPIQALGLMNDAFVLRQARALARRLEREAGPLHGDQVRLGYRLALGRLPAPEEAARAEALAREHGLEQVSWAILNSSELLFVR